MKMKPTPATTHKKSSAEKEVKEKHLSRFENLLMQIPVAIVVFRGNNYMVELANERALGIIVKEKSFIGKLFFESMPQLESQIKPIFDNVMQSGIAFNGEEYEITLFRNGKNEQAFFNVVYEPIREEDKTISGIIAAATEVTYEVNARKKIEESEAFKRSVLESSPDCVKVLDAEGRLQFMNVNGLCTMEIDDFSVFKNKTWKEFWGEENKHLVNGAIDKALAGNTASFQAFCPTAKGTPKWWDVIVSPVLSPDSNKINSLISVSRDMTEQMNAQKKIEESEAKYRHLFERMDQGFCIIEVIFDESNKGVDYRFLEINPVFENQTGLNNALGKTMKEMVPDLEDKWPEIYGKVVMTGIPSKFVDESESINRWFEVNAFRIGKAQDNKVAIIFSDVSERKTKEKLIQQSEQKISAILENAPFPIGVYVGKEMIVEHANQSFIDIWGKGNDVIGKSFKEILPELDSQLVFEQIQKVLTTGESFHSKNTPIDLIIDGNLRTQYFSYSFTPLYDINGNVYAVMNTAAEVTELNMAQKRLVESDKRFRNTMKQAPVGITILRGPEYIVEMANDAYLQIVDKKESEFVGISIFTSLPEIEESVHTLLNNVVHNAVPYHGSEVPVPLNRFGKQDVGYFDFIWHPLKEEDGKVSGVLAVVTDVTEKVETRKIIEASEKQFNTLANNIQNLAWIANGAGHIYWYNQRWYDYTATTLEEMKGQGWEKVHHPEHVDRVVDFIKQAWQVNQPFELTFPLRGANGEYRWFLTRAFPVCDEEGKISNWIGTNTDITDQKSFTEQLEIKVEERTAELYNKNEELEKMNKELESFAYISSHDLQEPLRKIQTFVSRILDKEENNLSDDGKDMFKRMRNSAERMQTLIQDLLAYSRIKTEERKFEKTDLNKIIAEVREDLKEELKDKHATIEATELCEAHIIPFQFRQLLHNLIGNSLKFSNPQYPPHIKIECEVAKGIKFKNEKLSPQKKYCHISVSDNGIGFEQQYSEKIFEVFQYLHGKNEYNGTGIGLAIVKKIVENHNGIITANGELNKGATFEIYIPAT